MRAALLSLAATTLIGGIALAETSVAPTPPAPRSQEQVSPPRAQASPAGPGQPATGQSTQAPGQARADGCAGRRDVLGVSRVVEIDTAGGPLFGQQQYKDNDFLEDGEVVLTFDDGPLRTYTVPVLAALDAHCTRATFFVVGRMAASDPELVRETMRRGHTIGTHTWSHRNQRTISGPTARSEVELAISTVAKAAGQPIAPFFRYPYLADSRSMTQHLKSRDQGIFSIDVDSRDFRTRNPAEVQRVILAQLAQRRKGILLFHDIQPSTAGALKALLGELKARGFKVVHMVSKSPAATLPEFDAQADKELSRRQQIVARTPLANRSIVWPVATGGEASGDAAGSAPVSSVPAAAAPAGRGTRPAGTAAPAAATPAPAKGSVTPLAAPGVAAPVPAAVVAEPVPAAPPPAPAPRARWRSEDDDNWQTRLFRN